MSVIWLKRRNLIALMAGKYSYSLISTLFLAHSAILENLCETWSCLNSVNGYKFSLIWLSLELDRSCVSVKAITSPLQIEESKFMSALCLLRGMILRRLITNSVGFLWFICWSRMVIATIFVNLSHSSCTLGFALTCLCFQVHKRLVMF